MIGIYKIENLINGKVYIGQSKNIKQRWSQHRRYIYSKYYLARKNKPQLYLDMELYGIKNFSFSVLEECSLNELNEKEKYYIKLYNSYVKWENSNGYNLTRGGSFFKEKEKTEIENKIISLWEEGKSINVIHNIMHMNHDTIRTIIEINCPDYSHEESLRRGAQQAEKLNKKPVNRYSLSGILLSTYPSINEAAVKFNYNPDRISLCANKRNITSYNSFWIFVDDDQEKVLSEKMALVKRFMAVEQYDLNGNYIKTYETIAEAAKEQCVSSSCISKSCKNIGYTCNNYFWKRVIDSNPICTIRLESGFTKRPIKQYSLEGDFIKEYESISQGARENNISFSSIRGCCTFNSKSAGGFLWRYSDDKTPVLPYKRKHTVDSKNNIGIDKYSLDNEFIQHYRTLTEASRSVGLKTCSPRITACCKGERENYKNYIWKFSNY